MKRLAVPAVLVLLLVGGLAGCSSLGGSAIRTGAVQLPAYSGPVALYAVAKPPANAVDLGVVEVHASQQDANVATLLPQFVKKVADIGGNVAVIEGVRARFDVAGHTQIETFYYTCALGMTCAGQRAYSSADEIMVVSMFGHAMTTQLPDIGAPLIPKDQTMTPDEPAVDSGPPSPSEAAPLDIPPSAPPTEPVP
jgi:hypothetical protein